MTCLSNDRLSIHPFDIFVANKPGDIEGNRKHFYVCVYTQELDPTNTLSNDVYGLFITTNQKYKTIKNDYNVEIKICGRTCFVCCDKLNRFKIDENVALKRAVLSENKIAEIKFMMNKFISELKRQVSLGGTYNGIHTAKIEKI